jgi:hypothetical protein
MARRRYLHSLRSSWRCDHAQLLRLRSSLLSLDRLLALVPRVPLGLQHVEGDGVERHGSLAALLAQLVRNPLLARREPHIRAQREACHARRGNRGVVALGGVRASESSHARVPAVCDCACGTCGWNAQARPPVLLTEGTAAPPVPPLPLSGIERERAPKLSPASTGKRATRGPAHASQQISAAKLQKRIAEFTDSFLVVKAGYLFCSACKCSVTYQMWAVRQHLGTDKHNVSADKRLQRRAAASQSINQGDDRRAFRQAAQSGPRHHDHIARGAGAPLQSDRDLPLRRRYCRAPTRLPQQQAIL